MAARAISAFRDQVLDWGGPGRAWPARALARAARLGWWALTRQLPGRLRAERRGPPPVPVLPIPVIDMGAPEPEDIVLAVADVPVVSVIIACHGQLDFTLRCLAAIARHPPMAPVEVIVIDDASPDGSAAGLARVRGARLLRNAENLGYLRSCNRAAAAARGEFLLFLNNDTQVLAGAIDALVATFRAWPGAALAGAMLLYPDGRLQEAGGILWRDGGAWNFGRGGDPRDGEYLYPREVDYCSGAALMARRAVFARLDGFDARYAPAYCEDSDLALRVRAAGWQCVYQPEARVVHWEGVSHGTDPAHGGKAYQARNQARLAARWHATLAGHAEAGTSVLRAAARALRRKVVLVVDQHVPEPDRDAGSRTMADLLAALRAADAHVIFLPRDGTGRGRYGDALRDAGIHVLLAADLHRWMRAHGREIDAVLLSRPEVAAWALPMARRFTRARVVFYGHDLHALRLAGLARLGLASRREARAMLRLERRVWRGCDAALYPSAAEARAVRRLAPRAPVGVLPPYACVSPTSGLAPRGTAPGAAPGTAPGTAALLFVGNFAHAPNRDAAAWLAREIFPLVRRTVPGAELWLVGARPDAAVRALAGGGVVLRADVTGGELAALLRAARAAVVPLRAGAGVKLKVVEAMAAGLPVVTTPVGAQGLPGLGGVAAVAGSAEGLAAAAARLLEDDALWRARSAAGRDYVAARFPPEAQRHALLAALGLRCSAG